MGHIAISDVSETVSTGFVGRVTLPVRLWFAAERASLIPSSHSNFLLAKRLMKNLGCTALSYPVLPNSSNHPLWQSWDLAVEGCVKQLHQLQTGAMMVDPKNNLASPFFSMHLSAFDVWLELGGRVHEKPTHLPIVLQVLLSQSHRIRALSLIQRYLTISHATVNLALLVGIFPYILKLLQSPAPEIRQVMISIWCNIIGFDVSCRQELVKDPKACSYFIQYLSTKDTATTPIQRCMAAFIIAELCDGYLEGQELCLQRSLVPFSVSMLRLSMGALPPGSDPQEWSLLRQWLALALAKLCEKYPEAKYVCIKEGVHTALLGLLHDTAPIVRSAAMHCLGELFGSIAPKTTGIMGGALGTTPSVPGSMVSNPMMGGSVGGYSPPRFLSPKAMHSNPPGTPLMPQPFPPMISTSSQSTFSMLPTPPTMGPNPETRPPVPENSVLDTKLFEINLALKLLEKCKDAAVTVRQEAIIAISKFIRSVPHVHCFELIVQAVGPLKKAVDNQRESTDVSRLLSVDEGQNMFASSTPQLSSSGAKPSTDSTSANRSRSNSHSLSLEDMQRLTERVKGFVAESPLFAELLHAVVSQSAITSMTRENSSNTLSSTFESSLRLSTSNTSLNDEASVASPPPAGAVRATRLQRAQQDPAAFVASMYVRLWIGMREMQVKEPHSVVFQALSSIAQVVLVKTQSDRMVRMSGFAGGSASLRGQSPSRPSGMASPATPHGKDPSRVVGKNGTHDSADYVDPDEDDILAHDLNSSISNTTNQKPSAEKYMSLFDAIPALKSHLYAWSKQLFMKQIKELPSHSPSLVTVSDPEEFPARDLWLSDPLSVSGNDAYFRFAKQCEMLAYYNSVMETCKPMFQAPGTMDRSTIIMPNIGGGKDDKNMVSSTSPIKFEQKAILHTENSEMTSLVMFHAYQDVLAISDGTGVDIWSLENGCKVMKIKNSPNIGASTTSSTSRITSMQWMNESTDALLMIASDDGAVKVWRDSGSDNTMTVTSSGGATLATAFIGLPDVIQLQRGSGLVTCWDQGAGMLAVGGNSPTIRLWDLSKEQSTRTFATGMWLSTWERDLHHSFPSHRIRYMHHCIDVVLWIQSRLVGSDDAHQWELRTQCGEHEQQSSHRWFCRWSRCHV